MYTRCHLTKLQWSHKDLKLNSDSKWFWVIISSIVITHLNLRQKMFSNVFFFNSKQTNENPSNSNWFTFFLPTQNSLDFFSFKIVAFSNTFASFFFCFLSESRKIVDKCMESVHWFRKKCIECEWFIVLRSQKCAEFVTRLTRHVRRLDVFTVNWENYSVETSNTVYTDILMDFSDGK